MTNTRRPAPTEKPVVLTIAGSDSGGGAGIQADLKTIEATGGFGTSAVTAVTAQNTTGVESSHVLPIAELEAQLDAVLSDFDVRAAKTGMLATAEVVETVADYAADFDFPLVVDPVMVAATGDRLLTEAAEDAYEDLIAEATLVTPNADEAAVLTDIDVGGSGHPDEAGARLAGQRVLTMGADAALVKGGHMPGDEVLDVLVTEETIETARHPRVDTDATHGSGCTLSAAIATRLARGESLADAVGRSVDFMERAVRYHHDVGAGPGAVHHLVDLRNDAARDETAERVSDIVEWFVEENVRPLVPEVGMNVVAATPYAEEPGDAAAVEGRITKTIDGIAPNRGVRFGASSHVARFLLGAREYHPEFRFAVNCRFDDDVEDALSSLDWSVVEYDRSEEPDGADSTMEWAAGEVFAPDAEPPVAVVDRGAVGKEAITKLLAADGRTVAERVVELQRELDRPDEHV
ncbi:bifunctional hydroxymethylpyrimidine kinase/phosphomethylpyrimidine kinase [Natronomonas halophila]|uniref:bifunctional hydroxymethylpyrimidine kinase/phosphomethylpyrimidine kinase n=1 Tax=Natronomonas halophila TaxID=2747817 RepID=UPI0015B5D3DB|nr:bifunctional hydroxymethylpyrimidine kinase/phosphomethylpyrimidine kinase [Natronomonas halophila]QLD86270.1 bifunctional hydroxymethylpyrimidine kinase/phosphomethylpyrimidine kinase [Natronomonas halophila]